MAEEKSPNALEKAGSLAYAASRRLLTRAADTVAPVIGGIVTGAALDWIKKHASKLAKGLGLYLLAKAMVGLAISMIGFAIIAIFTAFAMFIINSGAYVVPQGMLGLGEEGGIFGPGIEVGASCPIQDPIILCGSYGSTSSIGCDGGHGSNSYWSGQQSSDFLDGPYGPGSGGMCRWAIPNRTNCYFNQIPGSYCNDENAPNPLPEGYAYTGESCPYYGYALDISYSGSGANKPVYLPFIQGQSVTWTASTGGCINTGCFATIRTSFEGDTYEAYFMHLSSPAIGGQSGDVAGYLFDLRSVGFGTPHLHIELRINGEQVRPDPMCE